MEYSQGEVNNDMVICDMSIVRMGEDIHLWLCGWSPIMLVIRWLVCGRGVGRRLCWLFVGRLAPAVVRRKCWLCVGRLAITSNLDMNKLGGTGGMGRNIGV